MCWLPSERALLIITYHVIRRRRLLTTAIKAITSPDFSFNRVIQVIFVGEEALDVGGPRREFLRYTIFIN